MARDNTTSGGLAKPFGKKSFNPYFIDDLQVMCSWDEGHLEYGKRSFDQELWVIPARFFDRDCHGTRVTYRFYTEKNNDQWEKRSNLWHARLIVRGREAILDDTDDVSRDLNRKMWGYPGYIRIEFADKNRVKVGSISWTGEDGEESRKGYLCSWCPEHLELVGSEDDRRILKRLVTERLKQHEFREMVMEDCRRKCCVTGVTVVEALDAAHIVPFAENAPSDGSNGILLRSDIHRLFDRGLLAIEPKEEGGIVRLSERIRSSGSGYKDLDGMEVFVPNEAKETLRKHYDQWVQG